MLTSARRGATLISGLLGLAGCAPATGTSSPHDRGGTLTSIGAGLLGPASLRATVYASGLKNAAAFAVDGEGRLWVATAAYSDTSTDGVYVVPHAGATPIEVVRGVHTPLGLLWYSGALYVTSRSRVDAYSGFTGTAFAADRTILALPAGVGESNAIVLAPDGRMLMGITAPCDHCAPANALSAAIISFLPDGSDLTVYASHIRAPVGLAYYPGTSDLFVSMDQRDDLGTKTPGDWLALVKEGQSWGFPSCYGQSAPTCDGALRPVAVLDKHAAVSDVAVVTGGLGAVVGTAALVAEWSDAVVKEVALTRTSTGYRGSTSTFLLGVRRPVALLLAGAGTLFVGDWASGTVYRITAG